VDAKVTQLTGAEQDWLKAQLAAAAQFVEDYGSHRTAAGLESLDHAWASWLDRQTVDPSDPKPVLNAVGVALGQAIIEALSGFDWVIAEDADGTDLAIYGLPGTGDVLIYPEDLVAQRYETREQWFLQTIRDQVVAQVKQLGQRSG
jgi:uncharacterized protein DUF3806